MTVLFISKVPQKYRKRRSKVPQTTASLKRKKKSGLRARKMLSRSIVQFGGGKKSSDD